MSERQWYEVEVRWPHRWEREGVVRYETPTRASAKARSCAEIYRLFARVVRVTAEVVEEIEPSPEAREEPDA